MILPYWLQKMYRHAKLKQCDFKALHYVAMDLELTGLDVNKCEIVSVAWLNFDSLNISLHTAQYYLNKEVKSLAQSPIYHGIDETMLEQGDKLENIILRLAQVVEGQVLVCHNAVLDWAFIKNASNVIGVEIKPRAILDTMLIEKRRLTSTGQPIAVDSLTLPACRKRYQLPDYQTHNALVDTLATAELLLAQVSSISAGKRIKLADLM
ncbi:DNA polymerase III PolC-type [Pseudoalteromonas holothuriae]|uniref:DNA polymerase III PolC-type n=1 Tax=Pseudoalteromonas holothuriae TaxID=2963714 RepID=A0A9W4VYI9_9GAMM|nr:MULTISPECIES: 3'-5' exonuclease [unclassified Pseudoalteromonas]CAH9053336.1 DNA polymerase III PolC-type [Pseudoalteromonas sp. CIP111951]CAH9056189.1 DNA polymerase III PolC-type [Pseudoalteromonas sp. CIP111854]